MNSAKRDRRRAIAGVWVAMFGTLMVLFLGLAMDTSFYVYTAQQVQNIADASSLAGAIVVRDGLTGDTRDPIEIANDWAMATAKENTAADQSPADADTAFKLMPNYDNNLPDPDIEVGIWDRETGIFTVYDPDNPPPPPPPDPFGAPLSNLPNAVRVVARKTTTSTANPPLSLLFGPIAGVNTADIERTAVAMIGGVNGAGLIVLNPEDRCSMQLGGNTTLIIDSAPGWDGGASIQVDSDHKCATCANGTPTLQADDMNVVGETCFNGQPNMDVDIHENQPYIPDPLEGLPDPAWDPALDLGCVPCGQACSGGASAGQACESDGDCGPDGLCDGPVITACAGGASDDLMCSTDADCPGGDCIQSNTVTLNEGYYSGGVRVTSSNTSLTLNPGVYVMDNVDGGPASGLFINGGNLTANEVMFYIKGSGVVNLAGGGNVTISPSSDPDDPYYLISIFQARNNDNQAIILGSSTMNLLGTYYFPWALLEIGGTSFALGNQVIAWEVWMHGNATYQINYDGRFLLPGFHVMLVH